jgi:hypothetical protein
VRLLAVAAVSLALPVAALAFFAAQEVSPPPAPPGPALSMPQPFAPPRLEPARQVAPEPPPLPPIPTSLVWRDAGLLAGAAFALLAVLAAIARTRAVRQQFNRKAWRRVLARVPGPQFYRVRLPESGWRVPRHVVDEVATILARRYEESRTGHHLDVTESLRCTLRAGLWPHLVFEPPCRTLPVLVLQDVCAEMRPWREAIDQFLLDLERQGVPLARYYFDARADVVSASPSGAPLTLATMARFDDDAALLVVSTGSGVASALNETTERSWLNALTRWPSRSWLTPVASRGNWRTELEHVPMNVWPMTAGGLHGMACDLALDAAWRRDARAEVVAEQRPITAEDVERMKRLVALAPPPIGTRLAEALRARFCPDIPRDVVLHLLAESEDHSPDTIVLPAAERQRLVEGFRFDSPTRVAAVTRFLLGVLERSEPPRHSAAHLRWEADRALQRVQLADVEGTDAASELRVLRGLAVGPIGEEVAARAALAPAGRGLARHLRGLRDLVVPSPALVHAREGDRAVTRDPGGRPPALAMPAPGHLILAALVALATAALAYAFGGVAVRAVEHRADVYSLAWEADASSLSAAGVPLRGQLVMRGTAETDPGKPVQLYRADTAVGAPLELSPNGSPVTRTLNRDEMGFWYQLRAVLDEGNLALSNAVWVPGVPPEGQPLPVTIDAVPWARVRLVSLASGADVPLPDSDVTPLTVSLPEGDYLVDLENGGVTARTQERISVRAGEGNVFRIPMPGFDVETVLLEMIGTGQGVPGR